MSFDFETDEPIIPIEEGNNGGDPNVRLDENGNPIENDPANPVGGDPNDNNNNGNPPPDPVGDPIEEEIDVLINEAGDLVNENGEIVVAAADLQKDAEGNIILPDGYGEKKDTGDSTVNSLTGYYSELGYSFKDENGQDIKFENNKDGIVKLTQHIAKQINDAANQELFEKFPDVKSYMLHRLEGKQPKEFFEEKPFGSYRTVQLKTDDKDQLKTILKDALFKQNMPKDKIENYVSFIESKGDLIPEAKASLKFLQTKEVEEETAKEQQIIEQNKKEEERVNKYWQDIFSTIQSGKLAAYKGENSSGVELALPKEEQTKFMDYIGKPINEKGYTQSNIDAMNEDVNTKLAFEYLRYKKFNLASLVSNLIKTEEAKKIKQRVVKFEDKTQQRNIVQNVPVGSTDYDF